MSSQIRPTFRGLGCRRGLSSRFRAAGATSVSHTKPQGAKAEDRLPGGAGDSLVVVKGHARQLACGWVNGRRNVNAVYNLMRTAATKRVNRPDMVAFGSTAGDDEMAYDIPPLSKLPEPGYYYHFKHDPNRPLNNYAYYISVSDTILKIIAEPKTLSYKYTDLYTRKHMHTGTADFSTYVPCTCFLNRPNGRETRCRGSQESSTQT